MILPQFIPLVRLFLKALAKLVDQTYCLLRFDESWELESLCRALPQGLPQILSLPSNSATRLLVIIPFRDGWHLTEKCLTSLSMQSLKDISEVDIVLVDNGSKEEQTSLGIDKWMSENSHPWRKLICLRDTSAFNFSALNNKAVMSACKDHELLLFLNNDVEFLSPKHLQSWIDWMKTYTDAAASGCSLLYPSRTVQHACVLPGFKIVGTHPLKGASEKTAQEWASQARRVPAVTGAALMVRQSVFSDIGGFDETLAHAFQDVDLCLKILKTGRGIWIVPNIIAIHHECATRKKSSRLKEVQAFYSKWEDSLEELTGVDQKISRWHEKIRPAFGGGPFPWRYFTHDMDPD